MVKMTEETKPARRAKRSFTDEFKAGAVRLVEGGQSITQVARDLDLTESSLRIWVERAKAEAGKGRPGVLNSDERDELARLRRENRVLREEREILKKAAAFFAKEAT